MIKQFKILVIIIFMSLFLKADYAFGQNLCFTLDSSYNSYSPTPDNPIESQLCIPTTGIPKPGTGYTINYTGIYKSSYSRSCSAKDTAEEWYQCSSNENYNYNPVEYSGSFQMPDNFSVTVFSNSVTNNNPNPLPDNTNITQSVETISYANLRFNNSSFSMPVFRLFKTIVSQNWQAISNVIDKSSTDFSFQAIANDPEPTPSPSPTPTPTPTPNECTNLICSCIQALQQSIEGLRIGIDLLTNSLSQNNPSPTPSPSPTTQESIPDFVPPPSDNFEIPDMTEKQFDRKDILQHAISKFRTKFPFAIFNSLPQGLPTCPSATFFDYTFEACWVLDAFTWIEYPVLFWVVIQLFIYL